MSFTGGVAQPSLQRIVEVASRKGVALDIRPPAAAAEADLGAIVKVQVFVAPVTVAHLTDRYLTRIVCLVSDRNQVDMAVLAAVTGEVAIRAATPREVRELTGGSIETAAPFGYGRDVRVLMDRDLCHHQWVWATGGSESSVFRIAPQTLRMLSNAVVAPVSASRWTPAYQAVQASGLNLTPAA